MAFDVTGFISASRQKGISDDVTLAYLKKNPQLTSPPPQMNETLPEQMSVRANTLAQSIVKPMQDAEAAGPTPTLSSMGRVSADIGMAGLTAAGETVGSIFDFAGDLIKAITPGPIKDAVMNTLNGIQNSNTPLSAMNKKAISDGLQAIQTLQTTHPTVAKALGESFNIIMGVSGEEAAPAVEKTASEAAGTVGEDIQAGAVKANNAVAKVAPFGTPILQTEEDASKLVDDNYNKAVKPSTAGIKTDAQVAAKQDAIRTVMKDIGKNVETVPTNLKELGESIAAGKKDIWSDVQAIQKAAGDTGTKIKMSPIAKELRKVVSSKSLAISSPETVTYAQDLMSRLGKKMLTPEDTQNLISQLNSKLDAWFKNPTVEGSSIASVNAGVVNNLKKGLEETMESLGDTSTAPLRKLYGQYKSVESDVAKATMRAASKAKVGLIDYSDIFSGAEMAKGLLTGNPGDVIAGVASKGISAWYKSLNDPDAIIGRMFKGLSNYYNK